MITEIPDAFVCPITHQIMREPLMCRSGLTFERSAILSWLVHHNGTCPVTRQHLTVGDFVRNRALERRIAVWKYNNGYEIEEALNSDDKRPYGGDGEDSNILVIQANNTLKAAAAGKRVADNKKRRLRLPIRVFSRRS